MDFHEAMLFRGCHDMARLWLVAGLGEGKQTVDDKKS